MYLPPEPDARHHHHHPLKLDQVETDAGAPNKGQPGFRKITDAAVQLRAAGFGFGGQGATLSAFYDFP